jgi:nucleotide-binding universal stress UspA family protein
MLYNRILIPTDGSAISNTAARAGVDFAQAVNAEIVGLFVAPEPGYPNFAPTIPLDYPTEEEYKASVRTAGVAYLKDVRDAAAAAGLKFTGITLFSDATAREIVRVAANNDCDLIFMGSHGRSGVERLLLGSVTSKVLAICNVPVLVYPSKADEPG